MRETQIERQLRAYIYARVSKDGKKTQRSVGEQVDEGHSTVDHKGYTLGKQAGAGGAGVFIDNDLSASEFARAGRPDWENLVVLIEAGEVDVLVIWEPSRATRDAVVWAQLAAVCRAKGVLICVNSKTYDPRDPDEMFMLNLFFSIAERESATTRKRVLRAMDANAKNGRAHAHTPYGYLRYYDPVTRVLLETVAHPEHGPVVKEMFRRAAAGHGLRAIANWLDETTPVIATKANVRAKSWHPTTVRRILTNPAYIGLRTHGGQVTATGDWPELVDPETFYAVGRHFAETAAAPRRVSPQGVHLLTTIIRCGVCDLNLVRRVYYHPNERRAYLCPKSHVSLDQKAVDDLVSDVVVRWLSRDDVYDRLVAPDDAAVAAARAELDRLRAEYEELFTLKMSARLLAAQETEILARIEVAEEEISNAGLPLVLRNAVGPAAQAHWDALDMRARTEIVRCLMEIKLDKPSRPRAPMELERIKITWKV